MSQNDPDDILNILSRDARTSPDTIATLTGRSVDDVVAAIREYERLGVIKLYKTVVDWEKAFIDVKVMPVRGIGFDGVAERIYRYPEVHSIWLVSGSSDLRVKVEGSDMRDIGRFVAEKLSTIEGVTGTDTHIVMRRYKEDQIIYADAEDDARLAITP